jgi:uncharacterized protein (DUF1015 family)
MQLAGLRGLLFDPANVDLAKVVAPASDAQLTGRLGELDLRAWQADGTLVRDASRAIYRYHQTFAVDGRMMTRKLLLAAVKLVPWTEGTVRAHEAIPAAARDAELARLRASGVQLQPLLGGFRDAPGEVERLLRRAESDKPILDVTTPDGTLHRLWREKRAEVIGSLRPLLAAKKITLLDGHARYDALLAYSDELAAGGMYAASNYALVALVPLDDPSLQIRARHRVVRGALDRAAVLAAAKELFLVEPLPGAAADPKKLVAAISDTLMHQPGFALAFAGDPDGYKLTLSPDVSPVSEGVKVHRAVQKLDPIVIDELFVARALRGTTVTGELDATAALAQLAAGATAAIIQRPLTLDQVTHVAELGQALPAGASAFWPPIVAGLVMHAMDPNEDLV